MVENSTAGRGGPETASPQPSPESPQTILDRISGVAAGLKQPGLLFLEQRQEAVKTVLGGVIALHLQGAIAGDEEIRNRLQKEVFMTDPSGEALPATKVLAATLVSYLEAAANINPRSIPSLLELSSLLGINNRGKYPDLASRLEDIAAKTNPPEQQDHLQDESAGEPVPPPEQKIDPLVGLDVRQIIPEDKRPQLEALLQDFRERFKEGKPSYGESREFVSRVEALLNLPDELSSRRQHEIMSAAGRASLNNLSLSDGLDVAEMLRSRKQVALLERLLSAAESPDIPEAFIDLKAVFQPQARSDNLSQGFYILLNRLRDLINGAARIDQLRNEGRYKNLEQEGVWTDPLDSKALLSHPDAGLDQIIRDHIAYNFTMITFFKLKAAEANQRQVYFQQLAGQTGLVIVPPRVTEMQAHLAEAQQPTSGGKPEGAAPSVGTEPVAAVTEVAVQEDLARLLEAAAKETATVMEEFGVDNQLSGQQVSAVWERAASANITPDEALAQLRAEKAF